ncbi:phosphoglycerate mutase family protein [Asticcacaulis biprosthecium C19]|uniref:Phosphoglycerate mutase family protein n=1 Tax=Asticcacaulis biprosthecium C19 TaxID=715226 RepID=F4QSQ6_9CAUL|nr:histidine phosphatase family protein [Asticcacaulis biprosthecium]EGF89776.1 phosphoglycerate mutase family protein [Asticcacaulis biprosthecium C19]
MSAFYVLRHGQTDWNLNLRLQGSTDIPLNDRGRDQARVAAGVLVDQGITRIVASPLSRALETAHIVGERLGLEPFVDARLIERNFGLFEGMTIDEVHQHRDEMRDHMNPLADLDGKHYPHNAEPLGEVIDRVFSCVNDHRGSGETCLYVFHGIPFRAVTRKFLNEMFSSPNASPVRFEPDGDLWRMVPLDPDNAPIAQIYNAQTTMGRI